MMGSNTDHFQETIDIVLINGLSYPSDYSFLSTSYLRETWSSLKRADAILFTKNNPTTDLLNEIKKKISFIAVQHLQILLLFQKF